MCDSKYLAQVEISLQSLWRKQQNYFTNLHTTHYFRRSEKFESFLSSKNLKRVLDGL